MPTTIFIQLTKHLTYPQNHLSMPIGQTLLGVSCAPYLPIVAEDNGHKTCAPNIEKQKLQLPGQLHYDVQSINTNVLCLCNLVILVLRIV